MKKIYSLVLMAMMLLVGTNAWAVTRTASNATEFETAWKAAQNGDLIQLTNDVSITKTLWLGTTTMEDSTNVKSITLDLNGWTLTNNENVLKYMIAITHGELIVKTSVAGGQIIQNGSANEELFRLTGSTYQDVDPKTATSGYYSHLVIEEGVTIDAKKNAIVIDEVYNGWGYVDANKTACYIHPDHAWATADETVPSARPYSSHMFRVDATKTDAGRGMANGVRVDVKGIIRGGKYAFKTNGNVAGPANPIIANPSAFYKDRAKKTAYASTDVLVPDYSPYIRIYGTADLRVPASNEVDKKPVAVYCSGYARWLIEGTCVGATGVYVKSGEVDIHDATIESNYTGTYQPAQATGSGVVASGSAIVMESNSVYAGNIDVTVSGDTKVTATNGYAIDEAVTYTGAESKVDAITITGGSFQGGDVRNQADIDAGKPVVEGVMNVSDITATEAADKNDSTTITILGASTGEGASTIGNKTLEEYLETQTNETHITYVQDENGKTTMVISEGAAPAGDPVNPTTTWHFVDSIAGADSRPDVAWTEIEAASIPTGKTVQVGELQITSGTAGNLQQLTIVDGAALQVDHLVMNAYARIIVEAGGKLIVDGSQGIVAPSVDNIVLKTSDAAQALFLIKPVANGSNRHPNASVEFTSRSYRVNNTNYAWQRFGIPTHAALKEITAVKNAENIGTAFASFDYDNNEWVRFGYINTPGYTMDYSKMANPFEYYQMLNNISTQGTVVTMKGELVGNTNPGLHVRGNFWNGYANSYMAPINGVQLLSMIPDGTVDKAFYLYKIDDNGQATWEAASIPFMQDILPMQPFLLRNTQAAADVTINYEAAVYNPAMGIDPNNAPARRAALDMTKVKMIVKGANGTDYVGIVEDATLSAEFDNGYDAVKYMNDGINMYVTADEKMAIFATDNLNNTYVGFQTVNGGTYTIEFANVLGEELTLIDHETGARVAMVEGNAYEFTAAANSVNDYRFEIVESAKLPTAIDNTEAVKSAKGIYTITGQYVGEMNVWNTLPAGVYVINGEKRVK